MSYNYITNKDSGNFTPASQSTAVFGMPRVIEGITIHWWGDPNLNPQFDSVVNYLCRSGGNSSAHFVATGTDRKVACIVAPHDVAWHSGSAWGNARTIGIELDPRARDEDYDVAAELIADIRSAYGDVPIYWHSYFQATACPGVWDPYRLDELSYTKFSHATEWGHGGDITPKQPVTPPAQPTTPTTTPSPILFKLLADGKQVAAYSTEANAFKGYVQYGRTGRIMYDGKDVTDALVDKFTEPSPTSTPPEQGGGKPVAEKPDYVAKIEENNALLKAIQTALQELIGFINSIFKGGR